MVADDDPALQAALVSPAFYVGALGSKQTQAKRRERLLAAGARLKRSFPTNANAAPRR